MDHMTSREWVRKVAEELTHGQEWPTSDKVRNLIVEHTKGGLNPSNSTVHDELKRWFGDTFWPRTNAFKVISAPGIPESLSSIYQEGFQLIVQGALIAAATNWESEKSELQKALAAAHENIEAYVLEREKQIAAMEELSGQFELSSMNCTTLEDEVTRLKSELLGANDLIRLALEREAKYERSINEIQTDAQRRIEAETRRSDEERRSLQLQIDRDRQILKQAEAERMKSVAEREAEYLRRLEVDAIANGLKQEVATLKETMAAQQKASEAQIQKLVRDMKSPAPRVRTPTKKRALPRTALIRNRKA